MKKYISLSILLSSSLFAQSQTLNDVDVIAQSSDTGNIQIDLQRAQNTQVDSLFDLFKNNSSIDVGGGAINVQRIYIRGIESSNLDISLDGARQGKNMFQHRGNELGINPDILKQVEVKTYTDASDNSGALGGSIIMTTKDAQDFVSHGKNYGGIIKTGYGTNANTKHGSLIAYDVVNSYFGVYANVSAVNNDNYEDGTGKDQIATAYKDRDYLVKFSLLDVKDNDLRVTISQNENSGDSQWRGTDAIPNPTDLEKITSTTTNYALQHNYNPSNLINLDTNLNLSQIVLEREEIDTEYKNKTFGLKIQNHFNFDFLNTKNKLSLGAQYERQHGISDYFYSVHDKTYTDFVSDTYSKNRALFLQNRMNIENLNIYYGLRFDDYEFETGFGKATDNTISPNIGFDYELNENSKIYANYSQSSRMTGIIPFTWLTKVKENTSYSDNLEAETAKKYEIGYKYNTNSLLTQNDYFTFDVSLFKTTIENLILARDIDGGSGEGGRTLADIYNNSDDFKTKGFEIKLLWNYENYTTNLSYSYIDAQEINDNSTSTTGVDEAIAIRRIGAYDSKRLVWNNYYDINETLNLGYTLNAIKGIDNQIDRPGYVTHDISLKYTPKEYNSWTFYAGVDNITDKTYGKHSTIASKSDEDYYRYEPGRNFKFSLKYTF